MPLVLQLGNGLLIPRQWGALSLLILLCVALLAHHNLVQLLSMSLLHVMALQTSSANLALFVLPLSGNLQLVRFIMTAFVMIAQPVVQPAQVTPNALLVRLITSSREIIVQLVMFVLATNTNKLPA